MVFACWFRQMLVILLWICLDFFFFDPDWCFYLFFFAICLIFLLLHGVTACECAFWFGLCDFRFSWSAGQSSYTPYRDYLSRSGYKPYYQRQQELNQQKEQERDGRSNSRINRPASTISLSTSSSSSPSPLTSTTTATTTVATTSTTTNSVFRRCWKWTRFKT